MATLFSRARTPDPSSPEDVAILDGTIQLVQGSGQPIFNVQLADDGSVPLQPLEPLDNGTPGSPSAARRRLSLEFSPEQFPDILAPCELLLPAATDEGHSHYVEISVRLEINQQVEGGEQVDDILDVLLTGAAPETVAGFEARIVDELGLPVDGVVASLEHDEQSDSQTTDDKGALRLFAPSAGDVVLKLSDVAAIKAKLKPRWDQVRSGPRVLPGENTVIAPVHDNIDSIALDRGVVKVVSIRPRVERMRLVHFFFDTSKTFLLPGDPDTLSVLAQFYARNMPSQLLIVGHADTAGGKAYNDQLSLDRADTVLAYLSGDTSGWLKWYGNGVAQEKRSGISEDLAMIAAMPDADQRDPGEVPVKYYQRTRGLKVDGIAGSNTRQTLVTEYMSLNATKLPATITPTTHGCGENFPALPTADGVSAQANRRAELYFFDDDLGIQPPPEAKNSGPKAKDYSEWVRRAEATEDASAGFRTLVIKLLDALNAPIAGAPYQVVVGDEQRSGKSDDDGLVHELRVPVPNTVTLNWSYPSPPNQPEQPPEPFLFTRELFLDYADPDKQNPDDGARRRLLNLGYQAPLLQDNVTAFQQDFGVPAAPWFDQATFDKFMMTSDAKLRACSEPGMPESNATAAVRARKVPVIIVPGTMGTRLSEPGTRTLVWNPTADRGIFAANVARLKDLSKPLAPDENNGFPAADSNFVASLSIKHINNIIFGFYGNLALAMQHDMRTKLAPKGVVPVVYCCGYDFRVDNAISAQLLQKVVNEAQQDCNGEQAIIIAHSMGGLVTRHFCKNLGGQANVRAVFLIASPTLGAPDAYFSLRTGLDQFKFKVLLGTSQEGTRQFVRVMPSVYQLLPNILYGQVDPSWVTFDATETGFPRNAPIVPRGVQFTDASQNFFVYRDIYTGLVDEPNLRSLADAHLATALAFDGGMLVSATATYMHPTTFLIAGTGTPTKGKANVIFDGVGGTTSTVVVSSRAVELNQIDGDATVPFISAVPAASQPKPPPPFSISGVGHQDLPNSRPAIDSIIGSIDGLF